MKGLVLVFRGLGRLGDSNQKTKFLVARETVLFY